MSRFDKYITNPQPEQAAPIQSRFDKYLRQEAPIDEGFVPAQPKAMDYAKTALEQGLQGATFGFADEAIDPLMVSAKTLFTDPKGFLRGEISDPKAAESAANTRQQTQDRLKEQLREMPITSIGSNVLGGLVTGTAGAATKAGAAVGNIIRSGNTAARIAKGVAAGAASGGLYGAGAGFEDRAQTAQEGALLGGIAGGAVPAIAGAASGILNTGKAVSKGLRARDVDTLDAAAQAIKLQGSNAYSRMKATGAIFKPQTSFNIIGDVTGKLKADGLLNSGLHGKTMSVLEDLSNASKGGLDLESLDQYRQLFGQIAGNMTPDNLQDARKASLVIDAIDEAVDGIKDKDLLQGSTAAIDALNEGRAHWRTQKKFQMITDVVRKADGDPNYIKREIKKIADSPKKTRGMSAAEVKALQDAASLSGGEGVMKMLGKFGIDFGNSRIGNTALPVVGGLLTGAASGAGAGVALPVVGTAARYGQKLAARGKVEDLLKLIESGKPVTSKQIMALPPSQAKQLLQALRPAQSSAINASRTQVNQ